MPLSYAQYTGNGSTTTFSVPFPYLLKAHVKVYTGFNILDGTYTSLLVDGTDYTWTSGTQIQTTVAPANGVKLTVIRDTPDNTQLTPWQDGSNLTADDLNKADLQNLYVVQEQQDRNDAGITQSTTAITSASTAVSTANAAAAAVATAYLRDGSVPMTDDIEAGGYKVRNVGTPTASTDAATKGYVDGIALGAIPDGDKGDITTSASGQTWTIDNGAVTSAKIADGTIVDADINAAAAIDPAKINGTAVVTSDSRLSDTRTPTDGTVTDAKVAVNAAIDPAKINGTAVVTSDSRLSDTRTPSDGSVTDAKVAANAAIDKTKISGTAITAADTGTVTSTMIADGTIVNADINASAAIAGTKISPDFGSQNIVTTGNLSGATAKITTLADSAGSNTSTPAEIASGRAKAWVNFDGTGTVAIRASYNVSSITDNTTGNYTVNFTNALADANYAVCASQYGYDYPSSTVANNVGYASLATTSVRIVTTSFTNSGTDFDQVHVAVFR